MDTKFIFLRKFYFLVLFFALSQSYLFSQIEQLKSYPTKGEVKLFDNYSFRLIYYTEPSVNTYRDQTVLTAKQIKSIALNPTGNSLAVIQKDKLKIYSFLVTEKKLFDIKYKSKDKKLKRLPLCITYSNDANELFAGFSTGEIIVYDTKEYKPQFILRGDLPPTHLTLSPNKYFVAAITGKNIDIWNFETRAIRAKINLDEEATGMAFSPDASMLAVTLPGKVLIYNTRNWENTHNYTLEGSTHSPSFNADDKYLEFVHKDNEIVILNVRKKEITLTITETDKVGAAHFLDSYNNSYIISNRSRAIVYWNANGLNPFYGKIINQEVDKKMNEWVKMMQDESMEDYKIRVNEETRLKQMEIFTEEATTALAADRISIENPFIGDYDEENHLLSINFTSLAPIEISVPESERASFGDNAKLKFSNAVYRLNEDDEFVLAYIEVTNEVNNKVYIYDNIGRTRLNAIEEEIELIPLEILQIAGQEESNLAAVTEEIVEQNKQEKLITENTQINVSTEVVSDVDADGNKILNYLVNYKYEVINKEYSEKEDFPSGGYDIQKSNAAMSLMKIIKNSFEEGDFAKYLTAGKRVKITITGSADGSPIRGKIAYDERYGKIVDESYYQNGELNSMIVTKATGITENTQLAFVRAAGVKDYLSTHIATLQDTKNSYVFNVEVAEERGGEFRRIHIQFTIIDAFDQK